MTRAVFVTGTGTDVGKTRFCGLLLRFLKEQGVPAAYYKGAMSGNERDASGRLIPGDAREVLARASSGQSLESACPYVYEEALSPHLAARLEGPLPDGDVIKKGFDDLARRYDRIVVEGSGGILCPLLREEGRRLWLADVIGALGAPSILVADAGLGTINATLLTVFWMRSHHLPLAGLVFNRYDEGRVMHRDNVRVCLEETGLPLLALVPEGAERLERAAAPDAFFEGR